MVEIVLLDHLAKAFGRFAHAFVRLRVCLAQRGAHQEQQQRAHQPDVERRAAGARVRELGLDLLEDAVDAGRRIVARQGEDFGASPQHRKHLAAVRRGAGQSGGVEGQHAALGAGLEFEGMDDDLGNDHGKRGAVVLFLAVKADACAAGKNEQQLQQAVVYMGVYLPVARRATRRDFLDMQKLADGFALAFPVERKLGNQNAHGRCCPLVSDRLLLE
ncbi:hypothetical protein SDC9_174167 [bioreactor metagenome]|uniref:Uncharacterized protein n=1 Tax=bioreactor metagenome TaxID=1076179 RepID=A0A645GLJ9_9ZZZZ